ncbi:hypothetical protein DPMN_171902 [Dreissena polymorpha]|uniref:Uncharacterized protein n=1 Tax=Dreissena polymorpha TaxID=45954 RepID=A0A9D4IG07_DREPO|nr:hypothetical protein DPMN_171902 [Dreissena polymorpha]
MEKILGVKADNEVQKKRWIEPFQELLYRPASAKPPDKPQAICQSSVVKKRWIEPFQELLYRQASARSPDKPLAICQSSVAYSRRKISTAQSSSWISASLQDLTAYCQKLYRLTSRPGRSNSTRSSA